MPHRGNGAATRGTAHDAIEHRRWHVAGSLGDPAAGFAGAPHRPVDPCSMWHAPQTEVPQTEVPQPDRRLGQQPEAPHADACAFMPRNWPPLLV
jgi:hypothetical protein